MPAERMASVLSPAPPLPPLMMAPAWPMRRPGGAVTPAMKPTMGFLVLFRLNELGRVFLGRAADLADHDDRLGGGVRQEHFQHVDEFRALDRVAADADSGGLPKAGLGGLEDGFVGEGAGSGDDTDGAGLEDRAGHDADLALVGRQYARAVGPDEARSSSRTARA